MQRRYTGVFPVVPTTFHEDGTLDLESQKRCLDFMIDAGSNGLCILANFSEQFSLSDEEREVITRTALEHVAGRVPGIDEAAFQQAADGAKKNCPVSKALTGVPEISLTASLGS